MEGKKREKIEKKEGKTRGNGGRKVVGGGGIEWREQEDEGANQTCLSPQGCRVTD